MKWLKLYWYMWMQEFNERMYKSTKESDDVRNKYARKSDYYLEKIREMEKSFNY